MIKNDCQYQVCVCLHSKCVEYNNKSLDSTSRLDNKIIMYWMCIYYCVMLSVMGKSDVKEGGRRNTELLVPQSIRFLITNTVELDAIENLM